jgi:hypothetical protein
MAQSTDERVLGEQAPEQAQAQEQGNVTEDPNYHWETVMCSPLVCSCDFNWLEDRDDDHRVEGSFHAVHPQGTVFTVQVPYFGEYVEDSGVFPEDDYFYNDVNDVGEVVKELVTRMLWVLDQVVMCHNMQQLRERYHAGEEYFTRFYDDVRHVLNDLRTFVSAHQELSRGLHLDVSAPETLRDVESMFREVLGMGEDFDEEFHEAFRVVEQHM